MVAGFILEGDMEVDFLKQICPAATSVALRCNGKNVCASVIAKRAAPLIRSITRRNYIPIFLILDREERKASSLEFGKQIQDELVKNGIGYNKLEVIIVGRKTEDWICKDVCSLSKYAEGKVGKSKKLEKATHAGEILGAIGYNKRVDGPQLLKRACVRTIAEQSGTFSYFVSRINHHKVTCFWLAPLMGV